MNDIYLIITRCKLYNYADGNTLAACENTKKEVTEGLTIDTKATLRWFTDNMMEANPNKFQGIMLKDSNDETSFNIDSIIIPSEEHVKLLGVNIDNHMNFHHHTNTVCKKAAVQLKVLQRLSHYHDQPSRMQIFRCFILAHFNFCSLVWHFCGLVQTSKMERIQYRALKYVYSDFESSYQELLDRAKLPTLELSRKRAVLIEVFKALHKLSPSFMWDLFKIKTTPYDLRHGEQLHIEQSKTKSGQQTLSKFGASLWNKLPCEIKVIEDLGTFKSLINQWNDNACKCSMCS